MAVDQGRGKKDATIPLTLPLSSSTTILFVNQNTQSRLERVLAQLRLYEHPLLEFSARSKGDGVEVIIQFKDSAVPVHTYYFELHPCDLDHPHFEWNLYSHLYD